MSMEARIPIASLGVSDRAVDFEEFYSATYPAMLRLGVALLPSRPVAEDVVQEAYAKVFRGFASVNNPEAYVRRTVVNLSIGFFRRRAVSVAKAPLLIPVRLDAVDEHDALLGVLDSLPTRQRAAIILRFYEQCTEAEIAAILRCRPGTVKSLLSRGIAALRKVVTND